MYSKKNYQEVEAIIGKKRVGYEVKYYVKWKNNIKKPNWEKENTMNIYIPNMIKLFEGKYMREIDNAFEKGDKFIIPEYESYEKIGQAKTTSVVEKKESKSKSKGKKANKKIFSTEVKQYESKLIAHKYKEKKANTITYSTKSNNQTMSKRSKKIKNFINARINSTSSEQTDSLSNEERNSNISINHFKILINKKALEDEKFTDVYNENYIEVYNLDENYHISHIKGVKRKNGIVYYLVFALNKQKEIAEYISIESNIIPETCYKMIKEFYEERFIYLNN